MPVVSVIIPTITGREGWLQQCVWNYKRTAPGAQIIVIKDEPSCGHAWAKGAELATGDYIHFTADDLMPNNGWLEAAISVATAGHVPAARVTDSEERPLTCESPLGDLGMQPNILVPFLTREQWEMGGWVLPCHYGTDDWITYLAAKRGIPVRFTPAYSFKHGVAQQGRDYTRRPADVAILVDAMQKAGYVPPAYASLNEGLREPVTRIIFGRQP